MNQPILNVLCSITLIVIPTAWVIDNVVPDLNNNQINATNLDSNADRADAVRVSVSKGTMIWGDHTWAVVANHQTPRGRFRINPYVRGKHVDRPDLSIILPFYAVRKGKEHPNDAPIQQGKIGATFAIHQNSGDNSTQGCILVEESELITIAALLTNKTLIITE